MAIYGITNKEPVLNNRRLAKKVNASPGFEIPDEEKQEALAIDSVNILNNINPFLILNEISSEEKEKEILQQKGGELIKCLQEIRLDLLSGEFKESHLLNLTNTLSSISFNFQNEEIKNLIEEIKLRAEIELTKLQKNLI